MVVTGSGLISRTPTARLPRLSGKDSPVLVAAARTRDILYLFAGDGRGAAVEVHRLPEAEDSSRGASVGGATPLPPGVKPVAAVVLPPDRSKISGFLVFATARGVVKKTSLDALPGPSARTFGAIRLGDGDSLGWARRTTGRDDLLVAGGGGSIIRFKEDDLRPVGLSAAGVAGMRLEARERLAGFEVVRPGADLLAVAGNGMGKRVPLGQFPTQRRGGKGVRVFRSGVVLAGIVVGAEDDHAFAVLAKAAAKSFRLAAAPRRSRAANGTKLVEVKSKDRLAFLGSPAPRTEASEPAPAKKGGAGKKKAKRSTGMKATAAAKKASAKNPAQAKPASKKPAGKKPSGGKPAAKKPAGRKPAGKRKP